MARHVKFSWIKSCTSCFSYRDPWNLFEWLLSFKMFLSSQKQFLLFLKFVSMSSPIMNTGYENACLPTSVFTWSIKSHFSSVVLKFKVKSFALICSFSRSFIPQFDLSFLEYGLYIREGKLCSSESPQTNTSSWYQLSRIRNVLDSK